VTGGTIPACKWVRLACQRQLDDLRRWKTDGPYQFDQNAAGRVCRFLESLPHVKGPKTGQDIELEPWQCFKLTSVFGWLVRKTGKRRFRRVYLEEPRGQAKALALDTPVATPLGFRAIRDIHAGDLVFGPEGQPVRVLGESPTFIGRKCFEVEFNTREHVICDSDHQWITDAHVDLPGRKHKRFKHGSRITLRARTTEEIARTLTYGKRGDLNHRVRVARPVRYPLPVFEFSIAPYVFGAWLGDGHSAGGRFTSADQEVLDAIAVEEGEVRKQAGKYGYAIGPSYREGTPKQATFQGRLRALGVLDNKHIPTDYLYADVAQRRELLCGLMDTDGTISEAGQCCYCSTNPRLARDVHELVASLGAKPTISEGQAKLYGRVVGSVWKISFYPEFDVFKLTRKRIRQLGLRRGHLQGNRVIKAVREAKSVPTKCLAVEGGEFLITRSYIPTHNSTISSGVGIYMTAATGEGGAETYSAATSKDQARIVFADAQQMVRKRPELSAELGIAVNAHTIVQESTASRFTALASDSNSLDGLNVYLGIIDELHAHRTREVYDVIETGCGKRDESLLWTITTAGSDRSGICYELRTYLTKVLEGVAPDESLFGCIWTIDEGDDWTSEATWCLSSETEVYAKIPRGHTVATIQALLEDYDPATAQLWDGRQWVRILGWSKTVAHNPFEITLRSGQSIHCTGHHEWPTERGKVRADQLLVGDILEQTSLPDSGSTDDGEWIPPDVGYLVGLYLAEGNIATDGNGINFAGHANEGDARAALLLPTVRRYCGSLHVHRYDNRSAVIVESTVIVAIARLYVGGTTAKTKYLKPALWRRNNAFLKQFAQGYLDGDGHFDAPNDRYRLGFCANPKLVEDFRTLAARLGVRLKLTRGYATDGTGKRHGIYRGEWRWTASRKRICRYSEIVSISPSNRASFYHLGVDNQDGRFAIASGIVTYNSKANPNWGISVQPASVAQLAAKAMQMPAAQSNFKTKHLNIWVNADIAWMDMGAWQRASDPSLHLDQFAGESCWVGLDLASKVDIAARVQLFRRDIAGTEHYYVFGRYYLPESAVHDARNSQYSGWAASQLLTVTDGDVIDFSQIMDDLLSASSQFDVTQIAYDPWQATQLAQQLMANGAQCIEYRNTVATFSAPMKEIDALVRQGRLHHNGDPILTWMISNVVCHTDAKENIYPRKERPENKIDGVVALIEAMGLALQDSVGGYVSGRLQTL